MVGQVKQRALTWARILANRFRVPARDGRRPTTHEADNELRQTREKLREKNERVQKLRGAIGRKDDEIGRLRAALSRDDESMPVFFIVGFAKSGTSWLMRMLNYHPEIFCTGEGIFFGRGQDLDKRRGAVVPASLYGIFSNSEYLRAWLERSAWTRSDDVEGHVNGLTRAAVDYFLRQRLVKSGKRIVGDKTPFVGEDILEEIKTVYPEAKVIHIIRDGRDVAVSAVHHMWNHAVDAGGHLNVRPEELATRDAYREDPEAFIASGGRIFDDNRLRNAFAKPWYGMTSRALDDGPALFGENYAEVRYEDLLEGPGQELRRLLRFLGADDSEEIAAACVQKASFESWAKGRTRGQEESSSFLRKGVAGDWKNAFTERDKDTFKEVAGDLMIRLEYEKDDAW